MGSSIVLSHFADRQSGKEKIKESGVLLENGEDEQKKIGRKLSIKYWARN